VCGIGSVLLFVALLLPSGCRQPYEPREPLSQNTAALFANPKISTPVSISAPTLTGAMGDQNSPAIAKGKNEFAVVWRDPRGDPVDVQIMIAFVAFDGTPLAYSEASVVPTEGGGTPDVAFDGTNYLVVWPEKPGNNNLEIFAARVTPTGEVLDQTGILVVGEINDQIDPKVACGPTNCLVAWVDKRSEPMGDVYARRLDFAGNILDVTEITVDNTPGFADVFPDVAHDGTQYVVSHVAQMPGGQRVLSRRISDAGVVLDPAGTPVSPLSDVKAQWNVGLSGTGFFVAWTLAQTTHRDVLGNRLNADGTLGVPLPVIIASGSADQTAVSLTQEGSNVLVAWQEPGPPSELFARRIDNSLNLLDPAAISLGQVFGQGAAATPAVDSHDGKFFVAYQDNFAASPTTGTEIVGLWLDDAASVISTLVTLISHDIAAYGSDTLSRNGTSNLLVWYQDTSSSSEIRAHMLNDDGTTKGTVFTVDGTGPKFDDALASAAGGPNMGHLVVWSEMTGSGGDSADLFGARIDDAGTLVDATPIIISNAPGAQRFPSAVFDGTNYWVVWGGPGTPDTDIYGARVTPAGQVLDPGGVALATDSSHVGRTTLASDGANLLVVWSTEGPEQDILGVRFTSTGTVLDATPIDIAATPGVAEFNPSVGFGAGQYTVVWQDTRGAKIEIYANRLSTVGAVLDGTGVLLSTADAFDSTEPTISFDGTDQFVVWKEEGNVKSLSGLWIDTAGGASPALPVSLATLSPGLEHSSGPCVRCLAGADSCLISVIDGVGPYGLPMTHSLALTNPPLPDAGVVDAAPDATTDGAPDSTTDGQISVTDAGVDLSSDLVSLDASVTHDGSGSDVAAPIADSGGGTQDGQSDAVQSDTALLNDTATSDFSDPSADGIVDTSGGAKDDSGNEDEFRDGGPGDDPNPDTAPPGGCDCDTGSRATPTLPAALGFLWLLLYRRRLSSRRGD